MQYITHTCACTLAHTCNTCTCISTGMRISCVTDSSHAVIRDTCTCRFIAVTHIHTRTHTHTHAHTHTHTRARTHTHTRTHMHTHTHSHTHTGSGNSVSGWPQRRSAEEGGDDGGQERHVLLHHEVPQAPLSEGTSSRGHRVLQTEDDPQVYSLLRWEGQLWVELGMGRAIVVVCRHCSIAVF